MPYVRQADPQVMVYEAATGMERLVWKGTEGVNDSICFHPDKPHTVYFGEYLTVNERGGGGWNEGWLNIVTTAN